MIVKIPLHGEVEIIGHDPRWPEVPWVAVRRSSDGARLWMRQDRMGEAFGSVDLVQAIMAAPRMVDRGGVPEEAR